MSNVASTSRRPAILGNHWAFLAALVFCVYETFARRSAPHEREALLIFGQMWAIFITVSIATRSPFPRDRLVFGAAAVSVVLDLTKQLILPGLSTMSVINSIVRSVWALASAGALVILIAGLRRTGS